MFFYSVVCCVYTFLYFRDMLYLTIWSYIEETSASDSSVWFGLRIPAKSTLDHSQFACWSSTQISGVFQADGAYWPKRKALGTRGLCLCQMCFQILYPFLPTRWSFHFRFWKDYFPVDDGSTSNGLTRTAKWSFLFFLVFVRQILFSLGLQIPYTVIPLKASKTGERNSEGRRGALLAVWSKTTYK